jgi:acetyl/propionyl-CoA carboxylase alpha subunit
MLSKLICHDATRAEAIARMKRALIEYRVEGIDTTIPFFTALMDHADFLNAKFDTGFIDRNLAELTRERGEKSDVDAAIAAAAIMAFEQSQKIRLPEQEKSAWREAGRLEAMKDRP